MRKRFMTYDSANPPAGVSPDGVFQGGCVVNVTVNNLPSGMTYNLTKYSDGSALNYTDVMEMLLAGQITHFVVNNVWASPSHCEDQTFTLIAHSLATDSSGSSPVVVYYPIKWVLNSDGSISQDLLKGKSAT